MSAPTLVVNSPAGERRIPLERPVVRLGAGAVDLEIPGVATGQLHVWSQPPKAVRVGGGPELIVDGRRVEEALLEAGTVAVWGPAELRVEGGPSVLEELPGEPLGATVAGGAPGSDVAGGAAGGGLDPSARRAWERLQAGLLVELGLADKKATRRWQAAVVQGEWDADACARDVLAGAQQALQDPRVVERAGRLQRDLVMASFQRGLRKATRSARGAARQGSAFLVANLIGILCYSLVIVAIAVLLRVKWGWSWDGLIDRAIGVFV